MKRSELKQLAAVGASLRIKELRQEIAQIQRAFPHVNDHGNPIRRRRKRTEREEPDGEAKPTHWTQTAAGRKRMSEIGKQRWKHRRAKNGTYRLPKAS